jgi:hypothetical protein
LRRRRKRKNPGDPSKDYSVRQDWSHSTGDLNYSSFVYLDVDRDGQYGIGDRPMGGIKVRLAGAKGHLWSSKTNTNGFANFTMSAKSRKAPINSPGDYKFSVSVPPGWRLTSGNAVQSQNFQFIAGSPAGIGSDNMVRPVGIAPLRYVGGRTVAGMSPTITAMRAGNAMKQETLKPDSLFHFDVPDDADAIVVHAPDLVRNLKLSPYPTNLGTVSPELAVLEPDTPLETIDFNNVSTRGLRKIPSGFAGLSWFNLNAMAQDFHGGHEGYVNGNISGDHVCYTSSGHPGEVWSDRPFGFHSVMLTAAWLQSEGESAKIESWLGNKLIATDIVTVSALTPIHYAPILKEVTRIRFSAKHHWQLTIVDLTLAR